MLNFIKTLFRPLFEVILWVILIGCAITGWALGSSGTMLFTAYSSDSDAYPLIGLIVGLLVGIIIDAFLGWFVAVNYNVDRNLERAANSLENIENLMRLQAPSTPQSFHPRSPHPYPTGGVVDINISPAVDNSEKWKGFTP